MNSDANVTDVKVTEVNVTDVKVTEANTIQENAIQANDYQDKNAPKVMTRKDLWKVGLRGLFMEGNFNYERMQAGGFCFSMIPALKKIHRDPKDLSLALKNNLSFYNAHPKLFTFPLGLTIAMEENKEKPETISAIKAATMGPTGGIGDAIDHMTMMPLTLGIGAAISLQGSVAGPIVAFVLYQIYHFLVYFWLLFFGYKSGVAALSKLSEQADKLGRAANIIGLGVLGSMTAAFVKLSTPLTVKAGEASVNVQSDLLDRILPNMLPLAFVWFMFWLVQKGKSPSLLIFGTLALGVIGHVIGIL